MSSLQMFVEKTCFAIKRPLTGSELFLPYIVLINVLVWYLQPNTPSRQKLLPLDVMFLKKQLGVMLKKGTV